MVPTPRQVKFQITKGSHRNGGEVEKCNPTQEIYEHNPLPLDPDTYDYMMSGFPQIPLDPQNKGEFVAWVDRNGAHVYLKPYDPTGRYDGPIAYVLVIPVDRIMVVPNTSFEDGETRFLFNRPELPANAPAFNLYATVMNAYEQVQPIQPPLL